MTTPLGTAILGGLGDLSKRAPFAQAINTAESKAARFEAILGFYRALWPVMKVTPRNRWAYDIYEVDWPSLFSPIEELVWGDIREQGIVLYPQHPVAGYFVDFGHPIAKVALECDGAAWHQDAAKDLARQREIEEEGWMVFRLTGAACHVTPFEIGDEETGESVYVPTHAQDMVRQIGERFGLAQRGK